MRHSFLSLRSSEVAHKKTGGGEEGLTEFEGVKAAVVPIALAPEHEETSLMENEAVEVARARSSFNRALLPSV
jgi:hypothetical protein